MCGYIASCVVIFPSSAGARKNKSKEQNVRSYFMLSHRIRGLLFPYEKNCYLAIGFYFFGKSIQKHPDSVCENDVNNEQNVRAYYMQTIEWEVNYSTAKNAISASIFYFIFVRWFVQFSHSCSFCFRRYSPWCRSVKAGHYTITTTTFNHSWSEHRHGVDVS